MPGRIVWFLVPDGIDDPTRVSGGNVYDREIRTGLRERGWSVNVVRVADPGAAEPHAEGSSAPTAVDTVPDGGLALVDGLVGDWAAAELEAASTRIRVVVLAHMVAAAFPDASDATADAERRSLAGARRVVTTSRWTADQLVERGLADRQCITVAVPGAHRSPPATAAEPGGELLCVGVIAPHKGQDLLLDALARVSEPGWTCTLIGSMTVFPEFASRIAESAAEFGGRVWMPGTLAPGELDAVYRRTALLVAPSRLESSGMALAEAQAHGIPVMAAAVGGIPDTLGMGRTRAIGNRGGGAMLVLPDDAAALADALDAWLSDPGLRDRLRTEARHARTLLPGWQDTARMVEEALVSA
ncbi:glycosyltransferase family 4 protein [Planctomonas sp. JC2975]|uniref:glycosyltransferase family 4 protein n=1 Tax=Planctomonas sp. JC2975 TaxID=2729626 RepID=UPI001473C3BF|nr:glycosyltransferase family 4 protein [Planctomonas sp. JC2975]NNC13610.1 glycosyltransferase family 4 protein [Planctomonas sp. JC2975]